MRKLLLSTFLTLAFSNITLQASSLDENHSDGSWGLQDLTYNEEEKIYFLGTDIGSEHIDLIKLEQELKSKDEQKSKINFLSGKLVFYFNQTKREVHLHNLIDRENPLVFDSSADREKVKKLKNEYLASVEMIPVDPEKFYDQEVSFPETKEGKKVEQARKKTIVDFLQSKEDLETDSKYIDETFDEAKQEAYKGLARELLWEELKKKGIQLNKSGKSYNTKVSTFISKFWHSEPRLLYFLKQNSLTRRSGMLTSLISSDVDVVVLHLHSTHNVCNNCRLQLVGATYGWLYQMIVDTFSKQGKKPIFHIIVSWSIEYEKATLINPSSNNNIALKDIASYENVEEGLKASTPPCVSFVKLSIPESVVE